MGFRHQFVIGDIQGCYADLQALLKQIGFDEQQDKLWFVGDIVARGEDSLSALRLVKRLCQAGAAEMVLGNHDINLIAVWRGVIKIKKRIEHKRFLTPQIVMNYSTGFVASRCLSIPMIKP